MVWTTVEDRSRAREVRFSVAMLALAGLLGCGSEATSAPPRFDPEPALAPHEESAEPTPLETPPPPPASPSPDVPATDEARAVGVERAIEPLAEVVAIAASVDVGTTRYVLYTLDGGALARARLEAEPDGAYRYEVIRDALDACGDDNDDYSAFDCCVGAAPDVYLAAAWICPVRQWGVARVERRDATFVRTHRRSLFAMSCEAPNGPPSRLAPRIEARDLDDDGQVELDVRFSVTVPREDGGMTGATDGALRFVLDASTLRSQLAVTTEYDTSSADVAGSATSCEATVTFTDLDADGHDDVQLRSRCTEDRLDERRGGSRGQLRQLETDCPWDATTDAWVCARPLGRELFDPSQSGLVAERPENVRLPGLGADVARQLAEARDEEGADAEEDERLEEGDADEPEPVCRQVVDDPAPPLRVRAAPTSRSEARGELVNGTPLVLVERRGGWARIETPVAGWVYTANLRERCD